MYCEVERMFLRLIMLFSELVRYYASFMKLFSSSVKLRPFKQENGGWNFSEKWILREAVKPFITQELVCLSC